MEKLQKLINGCKAGVYLTVNEHKDYYENIKDYFQRLENSDDLKEIEPEVLEKMVQKDIIIELQFYPDTPVGFYRVYHYDLKEIINKALEILKNNQVINNPKE